MPYGQQLARKRQRVCEALRRRPGLAALAVPAPIGSPRAFGYRNQAKLVARRARGALLLGVYRPGTHQVVDICRCPVHQPLIGAVLPRLRDALERLGVPVYDECTGAGWLRYVVVRASAWKKAVQVVLVARDRGFAAERELVRALRRIRGVESVVLNLNRDPGNAIFGDRFVGLTRETSLIERVGALKLKSRAGVFLQANLAAARRVYDCVVAWAEPRPDDVAVDLYAGVGAISFSLASRAGLVYGIEESPRAVLDAKENIRLNGFHNVRFLAGPADAVMCDLARRLQRIDLVTLNPPRKGADEPAREAILACRPRRVVYMSCDPDTLARDLAWFAARGYRPIRLQPFDLLPQTEHVECVAAMEREDTLGSDES
jgi:23S rRNA (uracil1939-C5)-methyltransferase